MPGGEVRNRWLNALKWLVTLGAFGFLLSRQPLSRLGDALATISPAALAGAFALISLAVSFTGLRWALTMRAYGAVHTPTLGTLLYYTWLGLFYNTYVPGAVGGDVVRGVVSRRYFEAEGTTRGLAVVLIDRLLGLSGLLSLVSTVVFLVPVPGLSLPAYAALLGPLVAALTLAAVGVGRGLGSRLPGRLGALFASLPALSRLAPLVGAYGLAVANHLTVAVAVHAIVRSVSAAPGLGQSLVVVPLSNAAGFFPFSVAGLGVRDTAFVTLYEALGVERAVALAGSLSFVVCLFATAGLGGLWQLLRPPPDDVRAAARTGEDAPVTQPGPG